MNQPPQQPPYGSPPGAPPFGGGSPPPFGGGGSGYGPPPGGYPPAGGPPGGYQPPVPGFFPGAGQQTEVTAIVSLVAGLIGMPASFCCSFLAIPVWIVAIGSGVFALMKISKEPARWKGKEIAIGGIVLGGLGFVLLGILLAFGLGSVLIDKLK